LFNTFAVIHLLPGNVWMVVRTLLVAASGPSWYIVHAVALKTASGIVPPCGVGAPAMGCLVRTMSGAAVTSALGVQVGAATAESVPLSAGDVGASEPASCVGGDATVDSEEEQAARATIANQETASEKGRTEAMMVTNNPVRRLCIA
jgi:hypothetical protein